MSAQQRPEGGDINTALAISKDDLAALSNDQRAAIARRKNANIVTAQIASTNWGKGLDTATQRAISDWGQRNTIDVTTEIFVLGGSIYLNAQFYINRAVDLIQRGKVLDYQQRFINHDARLDEKDPQDAQEARERRQLRIKYGVPDKAIAAVLTEITLTTMPHTPIIGVKWCPHPNSKHNDPVGTDYPQETALTRSARRAWKQVVRFMPEIARFVDGAEEDAAETVDHLIEANAAREVSAADKQRQITAGAPPLGGKSRTDLPEAEYVTAARQDAPGRMPIRAHDPEDDPYVTRGTENIETPFDTKEIPAGPKGPVTQDLFGEHTAMEPTSEERAQAAAIEEARMRAEDAAMVAEEEAAERRRGART